MVIKKMMAIGLNALYHNRELLYPRLQNCGLCGSFIPKGWGAYGLCFECYQVWEKERQLGKPCPKCGFFTWGAPCKGPCSEGLGELAWVKAAAPHGGTYRQIIKNLKYSGRKELAEPMGFLMSQAIPLNQGIINPWLVPIPLHRDKEKERGFNQSDSLARAIGMRKGFKVKQLLVRSMAGKIQAGLNKQERQTGMGQVFGLKPEARIPTDPNQTIILVDDVVTTGATLLAAAQVLQGAGCKSIAAITFTAGSGQGKDFV